MKPPTMAVVALLLGSCVTAEVSRLGSKQYPARPETCAVEMFPATRPDYDWKDIASVETRCHFTVGRSGCIEELRKQACRAGGDTAYGFNEGKHGEVHVLIATVGIRTRSAQRHREPAADDAATGCHPPCSPGYECREARCVALCNPACDADQVCNQRRICEAAPR